MSGHWRFCVAAFLLFAGLSTLPAFSNPLEDLFNPAPKEAAPPAPAPAPAQEACVLQPGNSTAPGQHWFYRVDGHRKCWFQAAEATVSVNKPVHHHAAKQPVITAEKKRPVITPEEKKQPVIAPEENEVALRKKTVADARAQMLSAATADASQPTAPAPKMVDSTSAPDNAAATPEPAAPIPAQPTVDRLVPGHAPPRPVDVETLLAASSLDTVSSSVPPAASGAPSIADADEGHSESTSTGAGVVLIALGLVFLAGSLLASRFRDPGVAPIRRA